MKTKCILFSLFFYVFFCLTTVEAARPKTFKTEREATQYFGTHYHLGCVAFNRHHWTLAIKEFQKVLFFFPCTEAATELYYYLGVAYYEIKEYDLSNMAFSNYLKSAGHPTFFEQAVYYKFCIAEHFRCGKKRRLFCSRYCPRWMSAYSLAAMIYDEVIISLPNSAPLAALALYSKGMVLQHQEDYLESVSAYQALIRRFPKHELAPEAYVKIAQAYCEQSCYDLQNPDLLGLAELNVRRFKEDFPRDERLEIAESYVNRIKENFALGLYRVGQFYEKKQLSNAAVIYYRIAIQQFPDTHIADLSRQRLICLGCEDVQSPCEEIPCEEIPLQADSCKEIDFIDLKTEIES
jgi:outer membrane protein assembly factor BamD (BamD/ComL family)